MKQIAIRASALTRQFSSVRALNDLTIEVPAGVVFGFLGPNGAGKPLAKQLWSINDDGETWEFIYFMDEIQDIEVPVHRFNHALG